MWFSLMCRRKSAPSLHHSPHAHVGIYVITTIVTKVSVSGTRKYHGSCLIVWSPIEPFECFFDMNMGRPRILYETTTKIKRATISGLYGSKSPVALPVDNPRSIAWSSFVVIECPNGVNLAWSASSIRSPVESGWVIRRFAPCTCTRVSSPWRSRRRVPCRYSIQSRSLLWSRHRDTTGISSCRQCSSVITWSRLS